MKKLLFICVIVLNAWNLYPQAEASNWYFGFGAGIQFNLDDGTIDVVDDGQLVTNEGCASISDENGQLLFYTDGSTVYNQNHQVMQNGTGLYGDSSSTQSAIIVRKPQQYDIYYVFTVDNNLTDGNFGLNYSEVDMTQAGGLGAVTNKNINLLALCSEKITAVVKDCLDGSLWVVTFASENGDSNVFNTFHAFEVNTAGVITPSVKSTFPISITDARGYLKLSPDASKLACANMDGMFGSGLQDDAVYLYDFDKSTGIVSNQQELFINTQSPSPYGVEFSPNNRFLYVHSSNNAQAMAPPTSHVSSLTQFDLEATDIQASEFTVDERNLYRGGLQLGPDGKIYRALSANYNQGIPQLGVINNPNAQGAACNYVNEGVDLFPNTSSQGLPPFDQSLFNTEIDIIQNGVSTTELDLCEGETYTLMGEDIPGATYTWIKDDVILPENDLDLEISEPGNYELIIDPNDGGCDLLEGNALVSYFEIPVVASVIDDIIICDDDNDSAFTFDFNQVTDLALGTQDPDQFRVKYYLSQDDADQDLNEIPLPFVNTETPQQIFLRIENIGYGACFNTETFSVYVYDTPVANPVEDIEVCDNNDDGNDMNGQVVTDLNAVTPIVLGTQDENTFNVSYHLNQADADSGNNALPLNYYNTTPDLQTIYARIENVLETGCFDTTAFNLIVNRVPEAFDSLLFQCDEDGFPDGFILFNLTEANEVLTGGIPDRSTEFYLNLEDAENGVDAISGTSYTNISSPQIIYVRVINDISGCYSISQLTLEVTATDTNDVEISLCDYDGNDDGFTQFDLSEVIPDILNNLPPNLTVNFYETTEDALLEINALPLDFTNNIPFAQTLYARVENENACYGISEVQLRVFRLPPLEVDETVLYCLNTFPEPIIINGGVISANPSNFSYQWSGGQTSQEIQVNEPGTYTVTVTNPNGCSASRTVTVVPSNIATIESVEVVDATSNNTITVFVSGEGDYEFALDNINGPYQESNFFDNVAPGFHTIYVRDRNNCGIVEDTVSVIGFPKFFTPNGDSYNDTWQIYGVNVNFQSETIIYIFDRYGKLLAQLDPRGPGWDGTYNGQLMPSDDYWFRVKLQDGRVFSSHFALKR